MPCRYDPTPEEIRASEKVRSDSYRKKLDKLTAENDTLREALLALTEKRDYVVPESTMKIIKADQIKHRKADLKRLEKSLRADLALTTDFAREQTIQRMIGAVVTANPELPLEPQLGFDPDSF